MNVVTAAEMRTIEGKAVERGISLESLRQRAGGAVAAAAAELCQGEPILVLVGPGNNGGDGLIAASELSQQGGSITIYTFRRSELLGYHGRRVAAEDDPGQRQLLDLVGSSRVIVDALLGIGPSRPVEGLLAAILRCADAARSRTVTAVAVDLPTGVDADTGAVGGEAFRADLTLCMGFLKCGAVLYPGAEYAGRVRVVDVGLPADLAEQIPVVAPSNADIAALLPRRNSDSNKGSQGKMVFVGGSRDFLGAPVLSMTAAYRAGAGLVQAAVPASAQMSVAAHVVEAIFAPLPERDGRIASRALAQIEQALAHADAAVIGPGMGLSEETVALTRQVLAVLGRPPRRPSVVDADALNALATLDGWWESPADLVLTPHPGEMSRLTGLTIAEIQRDRLGTARTYARRWQKVVVLKGAGTVTAAPDGRAAINPTGGPNLATAGTGDVLSGIIGGLLAQGRPAFDAAVAGVYLHGRAGDLLRSEHGSAGTLASDLLPILPSARLSILEDA